MEGERENGENEYECRQLNHPKEAEPINWSPLACASATEDGHHSAEPENSDGEFGKQLQYSGIFHLTFSLAPPNFYPPPAYPLDRLMVLPVPTRPSVVRSPLNRRDPMTLSIQDLGALGQALDAVIAFGSFESSVFASG